MRPSKPVILSILLLIALFSHSQEYNCNFQYKHLIGKVGKEKSIIADLNISGNQINGTYFFKQADTIVTPRLEGTIDEHGIANITEFTGNIETGTFTGMISSVFAGTWRSSGGEKVLSFKLEEAYPEGSIALKGYCLDADSALLDTADVPFAHLNLSLLLPVAADTPSSIRQTIIQSFFGQDMPGVDEDSLLFSFSKQYFNDYYNSNIDIYDGGYSFNWEKIVSSMVSMNWDGILVYRIASYGYTGGAHGIGISRFLVFDLIEMTQLSLNDIFIPGSEDELSKLLERKFRMNYFLGAEQALTEAGLWENNIHPSENFYLANKGIGFCYNPYELAPYSMGAIYIFLVFEDIEHILKKESPLLRIQAKD
jgi:hypothetical protein